MTINLNIQNNLTGILKTGSSASTKKKQVSFSDPLVKEYAISKLGKRTDNPAIDDNPGAKKPRINTECKGVTPDLTNLSQQIVYLEQSNSPYKELENELHTHKLINLLLINENENFLNKLSEISNLIDGYNKLELFKKIENEILTNLYQKLANRSNLNIFLNDIINRNYKLEAQIRLDLTYLPEGSIFYETILKDENENNFCFRILNSPITPPPSFTQNRKIEIFGQTLEEIKNNIMIVKNENFLLKLKNRECLNKLNLLNTLIQRDASLNEQNQELRNQINLSLEDSTDIDIFRQTFGQALDLFHKLHIRLALIHNAVHNFSKFSQAANSGSPARIYPNASIVPGIQQNRTSQHQNFVTRNLSAEEANQRVLNPFSQL